MRWPNETSFVILGTVQCLQSKTKAFVWSLYADNSQSQCVINFSIKLRGRQSGKNSVPCKHAIQVEWFTYLLLFFFQDPSLSPTLSPWVYYNSISMCQSRPSYLIATTYSISLPSCNAQHNVTVSFFSACTQAIPMFQPLTNDAFRYVCHRAGDTNPVRKLNLLILRLPSEKRIVSA